MGHTSTVADHAISTGHNIKWDHFEVLASGRCGLHCKIKETLFIRDLKPTLDDGVDKIRIEPDSITDRTSDRITDRTTDRTTDRITEKKNKVLRKKNPKNQIVYEIINKKIWETKVCEVKIRNVALQAKVKSARQVS